MVSFHVDSPDAWQHLHEIRARVREVLAEQPDELRDAAAMAASELVENAIKYGKQVPEKEKGSLAVFANKSQVTITVQNGVDTGKGVGSLKRCLARIRTARDREELYLSRFQELMDSPSEKGQLGLMRIAVEGRFSISCSYREPILTVTAKREIS